MSAAGGRRMCKASVAVAPVTDGRHYDTIYTERFMWTPQENAENVHLQNSIAQANALEAANEPFTMLLYPNHTHSISGGNAQPHLFESLTRFVLENL